VTERKRATGFVLMDAAFTSDAKFVRLARMVPDPIEYAACVGVFWMLLADCRRAKAPEIDWEDYTDYIVQLHQLRSAKLLTDEGFEPEPFQRWAPAYRAPREGTNGYAKVREVRTDTNTSGQVSSGQVTSGLFNGNGVHDGRHGRNCGPCFPPEELRVVK
jgi:hypothetical protein